MKTVNENVTGSVFIFIYSIDLITIFYQSQNEESMSVVRINHGNR